MWFSRELKAVGKFHFIKILELFRVILAIYWVKLRKNPKILYYPPASPDVLPVIRDIIILGFTRWLFQATAFHFHAGGLCDYAKRLNPVFRKLFQLTFNHPALCIRTSYGAAIDGPSLNSRKNVVIYNGIPDSAQRSILRVVESGARVKILFVALLYEEKGVLIAVQAVQELLAVGLDVELTCLGEWRTPEMHRCVEELINPEYKSRIIFPGAIIGDRKWEYFSNADIFLFPSYAPAETFGLVLVEAMCFSLPIVATKWSGIPEVVEEGSCAILCEPRDVASCRDALAQLVSDSHLRNQMGKSSRERFLHNFTIDVHREAMECALSELKGQLN